MFKTRFISMLVLLAAVATGARAAWTGGTYTATANEDLGAITVNGDATLTINSDVTVTVTGGINVASGTLTVTGPGTLVVTGSNGSNGTGVGSVDTEGGTGGTGGVAISGNIIVQGGATVTATGGNGGNGGNGENYGGIGGTGGVAISGNIIVQGGATVTATGGTGGTGATGGWYGGNGGNGGNAFAGTLTYKSGTVTANGGSGGSGAQSSDWDPYKPSSGSAGKAFANDVDFTQTTGYSVTDGTSTIGSVLNQTKVVISGGTPIPTGYSVSLKSVTDDATSWQGKAGEGDYQELPLTGLEAGTAVSVKYSGTKKVKSVKAVKKAAAAPGTDLSLLDCAGNERTDGQWTANCYMVHTAGDYKLPLVYGNAIKSGATNAAAYTGVTGNDNATATFPRHDGEAITDPWIKDNGITVASAELLWQDAQGLITAVDISGDYLTLTVGKSASEQEGNALVAAKDASGAIVWSWHIWVTKQTFADLTTIATGSHDYQVTPVNLGWVGDVVSQGYCTYYQWGRKDAFIPGTGTNTTNHTVYDISGTEVTNAITYSTDDVGIDGNIQNPTTFYRVDNKPNNTSFYNLWDAQQTNTGNIATATKKTVYDPCPAGFCVPTGNLYHYMGNGGGRDDGNWDYINMGKPWMLDDVNLYFPASGYRSPSSSGSLSSVGSYGLCWSASAYDSSSGCDLYLDSDLWYWGYDRRAFGIPVRAVAEE